MSRGRETTEGSASRRGFTVWFSKRARRLGEEMLQESGPAYPSVPGGQA